MTIIELEGSFTRVGAKHTYTVNVAQPQAESDYGIAHVDSLAEAQGVEFLCPGCWVKNGGARGTHVVICWFADRGVPDDARPLPGRWSVSGTSLADLTLAPSVDVGDDHCWHGHIQNGQSVG